MLFSVIIPTCNRNDLLAKCLNCLQNEVQGLGVADYEVIVTDDSRDNIARDFIAINFPWVQWVEGPKRGPAANRNNGAKHAKGEWLIFIDDDCEPDRNLLGAYWDAIQHHQQVFVFEGKIVTNRPYQHAWEIAPLNLTGGKLWSCNFLINTSTFNQINGFDERFMYAHMEDIDLNNRLKNYSEIIFVEGACVTHPPRLLPNGIKLGLYHESDVYYHLKYQIKLTKLKLIKLILNERIRRLLKNKFSLYTVKGFYYLLQELIVVQLNFHKWGKKYANN